MLEATKIAKKARKYWNGAITHRGQLSDYVKEKTGSLPLISNPVRWYADWEQINQILGYCLKKIMSFCDCDIANKWSLQTYIKFRKLVSDESYSLLLVEMRTVLKAAKVFFQANYTLEGDDPLILTTHMVHERVEAAIEGFSSPTGLPETRKACDLAHQHMRSLKKKKSYELRIQGSRDFVDAAERQKLQKVQTVVDKTMKIQYHNSRSGTVWRSSYAGADNKLVLT